MQKKFQVIQEVPPHDGFKGSICRSDDVVVAPRTRGVGSTLKPPVMVVMLKLVHHHNLRHTVPRGSRQVTPGVRK